MTSRAQVAAHRGCLFQIQNIDITAAQAAADIELAVRNHMDTP